MLKLVARLPTRSQTAQRTSRFYWPRPWELETVLLLFSLCPIGNSGGPGFATFRSRRLGSTVHRNTDTPLPTTAQPHHAISAVRPYWVAKDRANGQHDTDTSLPPRLPLQRTGSCGPTPLSTRLTQSPPRRVLSGLKESTRSAPSGQSPGNPSSWLCHATVTRAPAPWQGGVPLMGKNNRCVS